MRKTAMLEARMTMRLRLLTLSLLFSPAVYAEESAVRALTVPPELAAVTSNPEPSGIVWSPSLRRYLLVTDDAGLREKGTYHEPVLLRLGEDGVLDKTPIPIRGVKAINDPESICAGPDGTFFLVTSHSPNRDNRTGRDRRQLLQLKADKGAFKVLGRLDLTKIDGGSLLALAGLPSDGRLDVEGVTYHAGALFIGLKSPLSVAGQAVIVRLADPLAALRAGKLRGKNVERFAAVSLCVPVKDGSVCQGISDLTFLPDGSLVVSANAPKGGPKDHGGALWHLPAPVGKAPPVLLQRFPHLKPEGVTLSPNGQSLVVVFDRGQEAPQWTSLPLPGTPSHSSEK